MSDEDRTPVDCESVLTVGFMGLFVHQLIAYGLDERQGRSCELGSNQFCVNREGDGFVVSVGSGDGYSSFFSEFVFDAKGKIVNHAVLE